MSGNDTDFSAAAELALRIPDAEKRRVEGEVSDIGPVMLSVGGGQGGRRSGAGAGAGGQVQQGADQLSELESQSDLVEEQLRQGEIRNTLLRELLEDAGAGLVGGGGSGGGSGAGGAPGLGVPGAGLLARAGGVVGGGSGLGLGLGSAGALTAGTAAAGLAIPGVALAGILDDDSNENPGELRDSPGETNVVTPNAEVSQRLERLLENGLDVARPSWLGGGDEINVEDPEPVETDPTEEEVVNTDPTASDRPTEGGDIRLANAAEQATQSQLPTQGGDLRLAAAADRQADNSRNEAAEQRRGGSPDVEDTLDDGGDLPGGGPADGGSPGGSTPLLSEVGGPGRNTSSGAGLVEAVLGDVGSTPDGSPGGSTPSRGGSLNEARERRQNAPDVDVTANAEVTGVSERDAERIAEEKAEETAEELRRQFRGRR